MWRGAVEPKDDAVLLELWLAVGVVPPEVERRKEDFVDAGWCFSVRVGRPFLDGPPLFVEFVVGLELQ